MGCYSELSAAGDFHHQEEYDVHVGGFFFLALESTWNYFSVCFLTHFYTFALSSKFHIASKFTIYSGFYLRWIGRTTSLFSLFLLKSVFSYFQCGFIWIWFDINRQGCIHFSIIHLCNQIIQLSFISAIHIPSYL